MKDTLKLGDNIHGLGLHRWYEVKPRSVNKTDGLLLSPTLGGMKDKLRPRDKKMNLDCPLSGGLRDKASPGDNIDKCGVPFLGGMRDIPSLEDK